MGKILLGLGALAAVSLLPAPAGAQIAPPFSTDMSNRVTFVPDSTGMRDISSGYGLRLGRAWAKPEEIRPGRWVRDSRGYRLSRIESVSPEGAVIRLRGEPRTIALNAFIRDQAGLLVRMTRWQLLAKSPAR
ncbi:hypothetical protein [Allosphingosinicella sp.]|jgi:hypothetical protein|uniref:hypothetical protein n=1 Tax=Allosphingosinicella sp. TaxID=2823234 RepID=UPI002EF2B79F